MASAQPLLHPSAAFPRTVAHTAAQRLVSQMTPRYPSRRGCKEGNANPNQNDLPPHSTRLAKIGKRDKKGWQGEPDHTLMAGGTAKWCSYSGAVWQFLKNPNTQLRTTQQRPSWACIPDNGDWGSRTNLCINVHSGFTHNSQNLDILRQVNG